MRCSTNTTDRKYYVHPLTLLILSIVSSVLVFVASDIIYWSIVVLSIILLAVMNRKVMLKILLTGGILYIIYSSRICYSFGHWGGSMQIMLFIVYRLFPVIILSGCIMGYTSTELMSAYRTVGLSDRFCLGIAVFFRFFPDYLQRIKEIREGAKLRGLKLSPLHPVRSFELVFVPLLFKSISLSESLGASIIVKGVEYEGEKTNYRNITFDIWDVLVFLTIPCFIGGTIWLQ